MDKLSVCSLYILYIPLYVFRYWSNDREYAIPELYLSPNTHRLCSLLEEIESDMVLNIKRNRAREGMEFRGE